MPAVIGNIALLGSTGSVGRAVLDVVRLNRDRFSIVALAAGENVELLGEQVREFCPELVSVASEGAACALKSLIGGRVPVLVAEEGLAAAACVTSAETVVVATVGFRALLPVLAALDAGKALAIANKECLVSGGHLVARPGARIAPIDSEHSSIFQCLGGHAPRETVRAITLTASGGPFLGRKSIGDVTPEEAVKHPRWRMGAKISVDSATLMNKGLEVIEASWLFHLPPEKIDVLVHSESIVHGLVEFEDGAVLACLSQPDMRLPISFALGYLHPGGEENDSFCRLARNNVPRLDLGEVAQLSFAKLCPEQFPGLRLCYRALELGGVQPAVLNAANEVAVERFLRREIDFPSIYEVDRETLAQSSKERHQSSPPLDEVVAADQWARAYASEYRPCGGRVNRFGWPDG